MASQTINVEASAPPVLEEIGNQTFFLGSSLSLLLVASDADGDTLTFSASPLPLPENATLNAATGLFTFDPSEEQLASFTLSFHVSDGLFTDSETITITVEQEDTGGLTLISGRILDANAFTADAVEVPVIGAVVSLLGTSHSMTTDSEGRFQLSGVPSGSQILDINTSAAQLAPDGSSYAGFREEIELMAVVDNVIERPLYLPRIEADTLTTVDPEQTTVVQNTTLGITLTVPPHTAKGEDGNDFTGQLSISEVPDGLAPAALPDELSPGLLITLQPVGVTFATPVPVSFPNTDNLPAGSELDLWSLDAGTGKFAIVGTGVVSADGSQIDTTEGGIRANDWHFFLPLFAVVNGLTNGININPFFSSKACSGSESVLCSGNMIENHSIVP